MHKAPSQAGRAPLPNGPRGAHDAPPREANPARSIVDYASGFAKEGRGRGAHLFRHIGVFDAHLTRLIPTAKDKHKTALAVGDIIHLRGKMSTLLLMLCYYAIGENLEQQNVRRVRFLWGSGHHTEQAM